VVNISFGSATKRSTVSAYSLQVLREVLADAGETKVVITGTARSSKDQAKAMFHLLEKNGQAKVRKTYTTPGKRVIDAYAQAKASSPDDTSAIVSAMVEQIEQEGPHNVSPHCADASALNIVDLAKKSLKNASQVQAAFENDKRVTKVISETHALHVEIAQTGTDEATEPAATSESPAASDDQADAAIEKWRLSGHAHAGAYALKKQFGADFVILNGQGTIEAVAASIAAAQVKANDPDWITKSYKKFKSGKNQGKLVSPIAESMQKWVKENPDAAEQEMADAFAGIIKSATPEQRKTISAHLDGRAFDIKPLSSIDDFKAAAKALSGFESFIDHEGDLDRWHVQFKAGGSAAKKTKKESAALTESAEKHQYVSTFLAKVLDLSLEKEVEEKEKFNAGSFAIEVGFGIKAAFKIKGAGEEGKKAPSSLVFKHKTDLSEEAEKGGKKKSELKLKGEAKHSLDLIKKLRGKKVESEKDMEGGVKLSSNGEIEIEAFKRKQGSVTDELTVKFEPEHMAVVLELKTEFNAGDFEYDGIKVEFEPSIKVEVKVQPQGASKITEIYGVTTAAAATAWTAMQAKVFKEEDRSSLAAVADKAKKWWGGASTTEKAAVVVIGGAAAIGVIIFLLPEAAVAGEVVAVGSETVAAGTEVVAAGTEVAAAGTEGSLLAGESTSWLSSSARALNMFTKTLIRVKTGAEITNTTVKIAQHAGEIVDFTKDVMADDDHFANPTYVGAGEREGLVFRILHVLSTHPGYLEKFVPDEEKREMVKWALDFVLEHKTAQEKLKDTHVSRRADYVTGDDSKIMTPTQKIIDGLQGNAKRAALELLRAFPNVVLTSGHRDSVAQCRSDAHNISKDRGYLKIHHGALKDKLQACISENPDAKTESQIVALLQPIYDGASDADSRAYSYHFSGDAFDCGPNSNGHNQAVYAALIELVRQHKDNGGSAKFLEPPHDPAWHSQFSREPQTEFSLSTSATS
jgi:hypothetical protein